MQITDEDMLWLKSEDFTQAERRMIDRLTRALSTEPITQAGSEPCAPPAPEPQLLYAAASAVECLRNGRADARRCLGGGLGPAAARACRETARIDARFYLELARSSHETASPHPARTGAALNGVAPA